MKKILLLHVALLSYLCGFAQNNFKAIVTDSKTEKPLPGVIASIKKHSLNSISDTLGSIWFNNVPDGKQVITYQYPGYIITSDTITFPLNQTEPLVIFLRENLKTAELDEVFISTTRSSRTIDDIPTRIEIISGEELGEKANMKPGDIRMLLSETTGIQTQQTSAISSNSSIRIQGLDGKYTQIIRDGFPLYSGFSGGLGLLQITPLDLKQVEVIKGSSSTLYGGGAIAGLVNLISKTPGKERELNFLLNGTSALGLDASGFYSQKFKKIGSTIYAAYNSSTAYDPASIGLTAIPKYKRYTFNPKIFFYPNEKTNINFGINTTFEDRKGGNIDFINGKPAGDNPFFEDNQTKRLSTQLALSQQLNNGSELIFKNSFGYYNRAIKIPDYTFSGEQISSFTEFSYHKSNDKTEWIAGINYVSEKFEEDKAYTTLPRDYSLNTLGLFVQNTYNINSVFTLESGLRTDYNNDYGFFLLPRLSALYKISPQLSTRLGAGLGYKNPTIFIEEAERIQFNNVLPIDVNNTKAENSIGGNFDVNYKTGLWDDEAFLSINQLFFYTRVNNPIVLSSTNPNQLSFIQPQGHLDTKGLETNLKLTYKDFKLFVGYTLADVKEHYGINKTTYPLVAKHRLNNVLFYEVEDAIKLGLEAYYFSKQKLNDGLTGQSYWITGFMAEKIWEKFSVFINFENFLNTRQTKFDIVYTGSIDKPVFRDIYAPIDGFVVNGGIKIRL